MSKIIKSHHCVEAHPCRLDPVDVDAFFVNNQEEAGHNSQSEPEAETAATLEEILETIFPPDENRVAEAAEETKESEAPIVTETETPEAKEPTAQDLITTEPLKESVPEVDLFQINLEAEKLIDQSRQEASVLRKLAKEKAEHITGEAKEEAAGITERAKEEAARIQAKADSQAGEIIAQAQKQAAETLDQAKLEAEDILNQARRQAEELKEAARQEGLAAGHQEGLAKAKQEIEANLADSLNILAQAEAERVQRIAASETELLQLVSGIAEKVIGSELKSEPEQMLSIVREALSRVAVANSITVKINPQAEQLLRENLPSLQTIFSEPKGIAITADPAIQPGDCFIETEHGKVDARLKSQLERIMNEILKVGQANESG